MKKVILITLVVVILSCSKDEIVTQNTTSVVLKQPINSFTWKALNSWYKWQQQVPSLANESLYKNSNAYHTYLNGFETPQDLFESLKHEEDEFSWFIEDYEKQQQSFEGIYTGFGIYFSSPVEIGNNKVIRYIERVIPNSPAATANFKRGDIINGINNQTMTLTNHEDVYSTLFDVNSAEFIFTENDGITVKNKITINKGPVSDNPVIQTKTFDDIAGKKVGYIAYGSFRSSYNDELNTAFADLKSAGIQELILDLRINGGGSIQTCGYLTSMIYGEAEAQKQTFAELKYNHKHTDSNYKFKFSHNLNVFDSNLNLTGTQTINRLTGLNRLYVLTTNRTASASELVINALKPFIEVIIIGDRTRGKNEASLTLYDSPTSDYLDKSSADPSHKMAMQPIVSQVYNSVGNSDYDDGFEPDIWIEATNFWNETLPFGDENEVLLKTALNHIKGITTKPSNKSVKSVKLKETYRKFESEMYIDKYLLTVTK
ncbi:S41 family peptidase [Tenacibaculum sp. M341]|uniref:S41 family peptidase n=1 Tax=Tenacibaculum sp. M341 TaxID=2530339 RepID=UPI001047BD6A|nr:S41 family peptidase [Tenacibaculum sp. M341]TCI84396.1 peptidase S41 [Tenacibaculum sp. M341]